MSRHRYDLIAIDLDGTLLNSEGAVPMANLRAIEAARAAGITVTICTGRALAESRAIVQRINQTQPVIVSGGAMVADPVTGKTLERFTMDLDLVRRVAAHLRLHDHPSLLLKDPDAVGYDYLVVDPLGIESLDQATRWWFDYLGIKARAIAHVDEDVHPEHTVRIGAYSANEPIDDVARDLRETFGAEVMLQHFTGALMPDDRRRAGVESVHIVEMFNPLADKWQALSRLAARLEVPRERVAAIGDQNNDLSMVREAGLGIAMGNATEQVRGVSKRQAPRCDEDGVAVALGKILSGEW